jgi:hypothetical protein
MPLEIKEIVITASVVTTPGGATSSGTNLTATATNKAEIIAECVEQVLEILREKNER